MNVMHAGNVSDFMKKEAQYFHCYKCTNVHKAFIYAGFHTFVSQGNEYHATIGDRWIFPL